MEWGFVHSRSDFLAIEEPLQFRLNGSPLSITMRTPGSDLDLATGFLFTEGIIGDVGQILSIRAESVEDNPDASGDTVTIRLKPEVAIDPVRIPPQLLHQFKLRRLRLRGEYAASERLVCGLMGMAVSSYRYGSKRCDERLRTQLVELAREKPRFGYRRLHVPLVRGGERVNHKRVHRVYRKPGLSLRRRKRRHCVREGKPLLERTAANQEWALDFVHDAVGCGRTIRVLSVVDACTRECLALEVDTSFASRRVTRILEQIIAERGLAGAIRWTTDRSSRAVIFWPGVWSRRSSWCIASRGSRRRTGGWKASTGDYARSV